MTSYIKTMNDMHDALEQDGYKDISKSEIRELIALDDWKADLWKVAAP